MEKLSVFLGGTCNGSEWRESLIPQLSEKVEAFNPVVPNWDEQAYQNELAHRQNDDVCLYVLTPKLTGFYSFAEVVDDSNKRPHKTVFCVLPEDEEAKFDEKQLKSLKAIQKMVSDNGATVVEWEQLADSLNTMANKKSQKKDIEFYL